MNAPVQKTLITTQITHVAETLGLAKYCKDFKTHQEAQAWYKKTGDKRLDRDGDGFACDCLPGGNGTKCPKAKK